MPQADSRLTPDLPAWTPVEVPQRQPAKSAQPWVSRIGIPGAIRLGMARNRRLGAILFALLIPVGAVRTLIGSAQPNNAVDPWGAADPIVIIASVIGFVGVVVCIQGARQQRTNAVHSAQVLLRQANQQVTDFDLRPLLGSTRKFDAWAADRKLVPLTASEAGERASDEGARLMLAETDRGSHAMRVERFGSGPADAWRASSVGRIVGQVLLYGSIVGSVVGGIATIALDKAGDRDALPDFGVALGVLLVLFLVGAIILGTVRRHRLAIAGALYETLRVRDDHFTRSEGAALLAHPYLYDLWLHRHAGGV